MNTRIPALVMCILWFSAGATAAPVLTVTPAQVEFGSVREGAAPKATLTVENTGDAPAEIQRMQSSCPCVALPKLSESDRIIAPGERRDFTITYNTAGYHGARGATLAITANDANSPHLVKVSVDIQAALKIQPREFHWSRARPGARASDTITIAPLEPAAELRLVNLSASDSLLSVHGEMSIVDGQPALRIGLALNETAPISPLNATLDATVALDGEEHAVQIPVTVDVVADYVYYPAAVVNIGRPLMRGTRLSEVTLAPSDGVAIAILDVATTGPLRVDPPQSASDGQVTIPIYSAPDAPAGPQAGKITIITSSRDQPIVTVPVYFDILPPVVVEPAFITLRPGAATATVTLRSDARNLHISEIFTELDQVSASMVKKNQTGEEPAAIEVHLDVNNPTQAAGYVRVTTDVGGMESVSIPVVIDPRAD